MNKGTLKIYLADLVHNVPGNYVVPLNIAYLKSYGESIFKNYLDISLFKSPDDLLDAVKIEPPDILGFSNYSWNYDLNYQLGNHIKTTYPSTVIIMGGCGIRIDRMGIKAFLQRNSSVDVYMMFEGEQPFANFINTIAESGDICSWRNYGKEIKGCAYLTQDLQLIYTPNDQILNLDKVPSAYLGGYLDDFLRQDFIPLIETNRGCPFTCTYCAWGISTSKKVRRFPLERVYEEIDYIIHTNSDAPLWMVADANFGLFNRDELIAEKIKKVRDTNPSLQKVLSWGSHNRTEMNLKISHRLGNLGGYLIGVQSFDPIVQRNIRRSNMRDEEIPNIVKQVKAMGVRASVDVLLGLPGETKQSHLDGLRKCFDLGFDFIDALNIRMLPGSELETDEHRQKYSIKTKYRLIQGSYGVYQGIRSLEGEEGIRSTSTMSEDDILYIRLVHWLVWFGWNTRCLAPLLNYLVANGINPMALILEIIDGDKSRFPIVADLFNSFNRDAKEEWFETYDDLRRYYLEERRFGSLLSGGFSKMNFKYMAEMILNSAVYYSFIDFIEDIVIKKFSLSRVIASDIFEVMRESIINPMEISKNSKVYSKVLEIHKDILPFVDNQSVKEYDTKFIKLLLSKKEGHINALLGLYEKFGFNLNKHLAVEKILEHFADGFTYDITVVGNVSV